MESYLKVWAKYRKTNELQHVESLFEQRPTNRYELDFMLQISAQLALISQVAPHYLPSSPATQALSEYLLNHSLSSTLTPDLISHFLRLHQEICVNCVSTNNRLRAVLLQIIMKILKLKNAGLGENFKYLYVVGKLLTIFQQKSKADLYQTVKAMKKWWSLKQWVSNSIGSSLGELLVVWSVIQIQGNEEMETSNLGLSLLFEQWFSAIKELLTQVKVIDRELISVLSEETKQVIAICGVKNKIAMKQTLFSLKQTLFSQNSAGVFSACFSVLQVAADCCELAIFDCGDILEHEDLYKYLFYLQKTDQIHFFTHFQNFMREQSVMDTLLLNRSLSTLMDAPGLNGSLITDEIEGKNLKLMGNFNFYPISTSKAILNFFLCKSGIFIVEPSKNPRQRSISKILRLVIPDPMQFMLIKKQFWEDKFGYELLGLSMWVLTQAYCKELQSKCRQNSEKQALEYVNKLKITLCLFLLGLKFPVKMLQFMPCQGDLAWDLAQVPVLPGLLLDCQYLFSEFDRDKMKFKQRQDFGAEGEVLPWISTVTALKNVPFILHNHRGYEFFQAILKVVGQANYRLYAQTILVSISSVLNSLGIVPDLSKANLQQNISQISLQTRRQMSALLSCLSGLGEKLGETANRLSLLLLSDVL